MIYTTNSSATSPERQKFVASLASKNYKGPSVNDFLKLSGYDTSPESRVSLAKEVGMTDYSVGPNNGDQNLKLMELLRTGGTAGGTNSPCCFSHSITHSFPRVLCFFSS